jgi:outer membrane protein|tara:strand:+ start:559 stop:1317 length:759 start_codon:yes stop_codon:yes gene_type:complete
MIIFFTGIIISSINQLGVMVMRKIMKAENVLLAFVVAFLLGFQAVAIAQEQTSSGIQSGDWIVRAGMVNVDPQSNNGDIVTVSDDTRLSINFTYMVTDNIGLDVLGALPFEHDLYTTPTVETALGIPTGTWAASTEHLPPTVSAIYHFSPGSNFRPYVGVGLNYTKFFHESTKGGVLGDLGLKPKIDSTTGLSFQIGFDFDVSDTLILNVDYRKIDIEPDAELFTESTGVTFLAFDAPLNPSVFMVQLAMKF